MKTKTLILFLSLWVSAAYSQTLRLNLGISVSKLDWQYYDGGGSETYYEDPHYGYSLSAGMEYLEHKYFSVSSDMLLYNSGGKYSSEDKRITFSLMGPEKISFSYLAFGSAFNFNPINNKFKVQLSIGPRIEYMIYGSKKAPFDWIDKSNGLNKFNYGVTAGAGLYYELKKYTVGVNAQYLYRVKKLAEVHATYDSPGVEATEQVIVFGFSFGYRLKY
jgi:hypothetical protein